MKKLSINDCVFLCMKNGNWWTFWGLQKVIHEKTGKFFGEPSISAAIRELRKMPSREKYQLPSNCEIIDKRRILGGKGYEYRLLKEL